MFFFHFFENRSYTASVVGAVHKVASLTWNAHTHTHTHTQTPKKGTFPYMYLDQQYYKNESDLKYYEQQADRTFLTLRKVGSDQQVSKIKNELLRPQFNLTTMKYLFLKAAGLNNTLLVEMCLYFYDCMQTILKTGRVTPDTIPAAPLLGNNFSYIFLACTA